MNIRELQQVIREAISSTVLDSGVSIRAVLSKAEIAQVASTVSHKLPMNPDIVLRRVYDTLFAKEDTTYYKLHIHVLKNYLLVNHLRGDNTKEEDLLLIYYMMNEFKNKYNSSLTNQISELGDYFESFLITSPQELEEEIKTNPISATTHTIGENFVRHDREGRLIPTEKTKQNFNNFINKQNNGK